MRTRKTVAITLVPMLAISLVGIAGCKPEVTPKVDVTEVPTDHQHQEGEHGGIMVSLGRDSYHIEAVIDSSGGIRLYTLGKDESRVIDIESQSLSGFVKGDGDTEATSLVFEPSPQEGDAPNRTSMFIGKLPSELVGRKLDVTIPSIRIDGERFRVGFQSTEDAHHESTAMPTPLADDELKTLYSTPGGRYTADDIAVNGTLPAGQKFKGIQSNHDRNPIVGDSICPITDTKANPEFSWVIDGKTYLFCCPPCIDEFVKVAKSSSEPLPAPESFLKK